MKICLTLILLFAAYNSSANAARSQSSDLVGHWKIDITFENESRRSFNFEADETGRGALMMEEVRNNWIEPSKPSQVKWMMGADKRVTFSAHVDFPIGNVGRETGILLFKGAFKSGTKITGEIELYPVDQDPMDTKSTPIKTGTFEATRVRANSSSTSKR
jgi:hypothetical protein